jgi:hypothetical protein
MTEKPDADLPGRTAGKLPVDEPPDDGFPLEKDVSTPPPDSDPVSGKHKKQE